MKDRIKWFAKPLPKSIRFITTLQLTAVKFTASKNYIHKILFVLLLDENIPIEQLKTFQNIPFSTKRKEEIKRFFIDVYNNEDEIVAYLNREITKRYFIRNRGKGETAIDTSIKNIVNECIGDLLNEI